MKMQVFIDDSVREQLKILFLNYKILLKAQKKIINILKEERVIKEDIEDIIEILEEALDKMNKIKNIVLKFNDKEIKFD